MRVRILGPLEVSDGRVWHPVTGRGRAVLGSLVARAPRPATVDEIIDDVWAGNAPKSAPTQVYGSVHKLRQLLRGGDGGDTLRRSNDGYLLTVGPVGVDADRFVSGVETGLDMFRTGVLDGARETLSEALAMWRGDPFGGCPPGASATALSLRLENLRASAEQHCLKARIECGEHADVIGELHEQVDRYPFREDLWRNLLVALYRSGREAEALQEYGRLRATLSDELGTDPSQVTQTVYQQILDRSLPPAAAVVAAAVAAPTAPRDPATAPASAPVRQLPPGVADFAGRTQEVVDLETCTRDHDSPDASWLQLNEQVDSDSRTATDPGAPTSIHWQEDLVAAGSRTASATGRSAAWPAGVFEDTETPARGADLLGSNRWVGHVDGRTLLVWAGRSGEDGSLGRVLVARTGTGLMTAEQELLDVPGSGALRVVAAHGAVLNLVDAHGEHHVLDAATGTFR